MNYKQTTEYFFLKFANAVSISQMSRNSNYSSSQSFRYKVTTRETKQTNLSQLWLVIGFIIWFHSIRNKHIYTNISGIHEYLTEVTELTLIFKKHYQIDWNRIKIDTSDE
jgi:hypothetical protein